MSEARVFRRGGGIINGLRMTWPLVSLTATPTTCRVDTLFGGHYVLRVEEITRVRRAWRQLWPAIQIEHKRGDLPRDLCFLPLYRPGLVRALLELGYRTRVNTSHRASSHRG